MAALAALALALSGLWVGGRAGLVVTALAFAVAGFSVGFRRTEA